MRHLILVPCIALFAVACGLTDGMSNDEQWDAQFDAAVEKIESLEAAAVQDAIIDAEHAEQERFDVAVEDALADALAERERAEALAHEKEHSEAHAKEHAAKAAATRRTGGSMSRPGTTLNRTRTTRGTPLNRTNR